jgi:hypothetical protein
MGDRWCPRFSARSGTDVARMRRSLIEDRTPLALQMR